MQTIPPVAKPPSSRWIHSSWVDLLFCCGGAVWLMAAIHQIGTSTHQESAVQFLALLALLGTTLLGEMHVLATFLQFHTAAKAIPTRKVLLISISCTMLISAALCTGFVLSWLLKAYLLWLPWHYAGQSYGLALLYCYRAGCRLGPLTRTLIRMQLNSAAALGILSQLTHSAPAELLGIALPPLELLPDHSLAFAYTLPVLVILPLCVVLHQNSVQLPTGAILIMLTTFAIFSATAQTHDTLWLFAPGFFHSSQYLLLVSAQKHFRTESNLKNFLALLLVLSALIYVGLPSILHCAGIAYARGFAAVFAVVSLHHFFLDGFIWKLRNPSTRQSLDIA